MRDGSWGHGPSAGGGCHLAALVTSVTSPPASCPQVLGCPRAAGGRGAGWGHPGRCGGLPVESSRLWARLHPQPCLAAFTSHLDQTQPSELPGHPQVGWEQAPAACSVWSCSSCALSVCPSVPAPLPVGGVLARGCISSFHASPPSSSSYAWLCRCSGGILRKSKMFPKCFLFLNNSGDRGLPSSPMSLSV